MPPIATAAIQVHAITAEESRVEALRDRRRKGRAGVPPMYSQVTVRVLNQKSEPIEGHALNVSESGLAAELDHLIPAGSPVTVEFAVAGLGRARPQQWPTFVATAEVTRTQDVDDFPGGPYHTAFRFVRIPTIVQAQIARYVACHAGERKA